MPPPHQHLVPPLAPRGHLALTERELSDWGERFGRAVRPPLVVTISGELGSGKTTLVKAICRGCGIIEPVTSPTFALVHEHLGGAFPVYHLDLYRLRGPEDLTEIGWDDIVGAHALILVEWPERAGYRLPANAVSIDLEHVRDEPARRVLLAG